MATMAACERRSGAKSGAGNVRMDPLDPLDRLERMGRKKRVNLKKSNECGLMTLERSVTGIAYEMKRKLKGSQK